MKIAPQTENNYTSRYFIENNRIYDRLELLKAMQNYTLDSSLVSDASHPTNPISTAETAEIHNDKPLR